MANSIGTINPLLNHLVLEKVLIHLDLPDIKSFRLVCSFWNTIALPHLIKNAELHLEGIRLEQFLLLICSKQSPTHSSGMSRAISVTPFESYTIKISSSLSFRMDIRSMWSEINASIKYLTLHVTTRYAIRELNWLLLDNLPLLQKIKIVVTRYWGEVTEESFPISPFADETKIRPNLELHYFQLSNLGSISLYGLNEDSEDNFCFPIEWTLFFKRFPKIKQFNVNGLNGHDVTKIIQSFKLIDESPSSSVGWIPKNLEILDEKTVTDFMDFIQRSLRNIFPEIPSEVHLNHLSSLRNHSFKSLHLEMSPTTSTISLDQFLERNSKTLRILRLRRYPNPYLTVPITLTGVHLNLVSFLEVSDAMLPSLSFLPFFPSLKILHIILRDYRSLPYCEIIQNTPNPNRLIHQKLKSLYIEAPLVTKECIKKLAICFPSLESLRLRVNDEMFGEICNQTDVANSNWGNTLKNLYITSWDGLTDEGITGISQQILTFWGSYSSFQAKEYRAKPYIGNITGLCNLTIEMWPDYENHIKDWSIYYGILDLNNLEEITLIRSGISLTAYQTIPLPMSKKNYITL